MNTEKFDYKKVFKDCEIVSENVLITPEMAKSLIQRGLETNFKNRNLNEATVKFYLSQMESGKWRMNGETIGVDKLKAPVNGYHRLTAVVRFGAPVPFTVLYGVKREDVPTIDTGRKRTVQDDLAFMGVKYASGVLPIVGQKLQLDHDKKWGNGASESVSGISKEEKCNEYINNKDFYDRILAKALKWEELSRKTLKKSQPGGIAAYLILTLGWDEDYVCYFFEKLADVSFLNGSIFKTTAEAVTTKKGDKKPTEIMDEYIYGWNSYVKGRKKQRIRDIEWFLKNPKPNNIQKSKNCIGVGITSDDLGITHVEEELAYAESASC